MMMRYKDSHTVQGKDSVGISISIRLLLLNIVSFGDTVVPKCGHLFMCLVRDILKWFATIRAVYFFVSP